MAQYMYCATCKTKPDTFDQETAVVGCSTCSTKVSIGDFQEELEARNAAYKREGKPFDRFTNASGEFYYE